MKAISPGPKKWKQIVCVCVCVHATEAINGNNGHRVWIVGAAESLFVSVFKQGKESGSKQWKQLPVEASTGSSVVVVVGVERRR